MRNKFKMSKKSSKKSFTRGAIGTRAINTIKAVPMRGGFRL